MMGTKIHSFAPLPRDVSLEELAPNDNFYRRLGERLDLSLVRGLVAPLYANGGRPSVDPEVFFKLQLVMFFENVYGERQLMRSDTDRISVRCTSGTTSCTTRPCRITLASPASGTATGSRSSGVLRAHRGAVRRGRARMGRRALLRRD